MTHAGALFFLNHGDYFSYFSSMVIRFLKKFPLEMYLWLVALLFLFSIEPSEGAFTFCPFHHLGLDFCPGCGLGRSISYLLHGDIRNSFEMHPLGVFAVLMLVYRILQLIKNNYKAYGTNY
jgi:hypothetical protein